MWELFKANVALIKDMFWILFTLITTIIAVLTYRRAKKTFLQPLRSEVIKRQTDILVQLLDFLDSKDNNIYATIDYCGIVHTNLYMFSKACGLFTEGENMNGSEYEREVQNHIQGKIYTKRERALRQDEWQSPFEDPKRMNDADEEQKQLERRVLYKNGVFDNEYLLLTKEFGRFSKTIDTFIDSPFIPSKIQKLLCELKKDVYDNIIYHLQNQIHSFMQEMCRRISEAPENQPIEFHPLIIADNFLKSCKKHDATIQQLRNCIRAYLMIDTKWG